MLHNLQNYKHSLVYLVKRLFKSILLSGFILKRKLLVKHLLIKWLENFSPNDYFFGTLGQCYYKLSMYKESSECFENALKLNYNNELYAHNYFKILRLSFNPTIALNFVQKWEKTNSLSPQFLNQVGLCYFEQKDYDKSSTYFFEAIQYNPDNATFAANYIMSLMNMKNIQKAKYFSDQWLKKYNPNDDFNKVYQRLLLEIIT